jgi:hypothetical protein
MPHAPEMPIACPWSLMPVAALVESPGRGGSKCISSSPGPQTAARNWRFCRPVHVGSSTGVSAQPTI